MTHVDDDDDRATADAVLRRVRKLLDKAQGTSNQHEAEAFERKAAELISRHRVDPARLADNDHRQLQLRQVNLGRGTYVRARLALLIAVARPHDVDIVFERTADGTVAHMGGFPADLDLTEVMFQSLHAQAAARMADIRKASAAETRRYRRSFLFGFASRIESILTAEVAAAAASAGGEGGRPGVELALVERQATVKAFVRSELGPVRSARRPGGVLPQGFAAGSAAAGAADVGRSRLAARPALARGSRSVA
jgi:hypothetical protein